MLRYDFLHRARFSLMDGLLRDSLVDASRISSIEKSLGREREGQRRNTISPAPAVSFGGERDATISIHINQDSEGSFSRAASQTRAVRAREHNADWKLQCQLFIRLRIKEGNRVRWTAGGSQRRLNLRRNPSRYLVGAHKSGNFTERP